MTWTNPRCSAATAPNPQVRDVARFHPSLPRPCRNAVQNVEDVQAPRCPFRTFCPRTPPRKTPGGAVMGSVPIRSLAVSKRLGCGQGVPGGVIPG